jgi:hypothetical protein
MRLLATFIEHNALVEGKWLQAQYKFCRDTTVDTNRKSCLVLTSGEKMYQGLEQSSFTKASKYINLRNSQSDFTQAHPVVVLYELRDDEGVEGARR